MTTEDNRNGNGNLITIELTEDVKQLVTNYVYNPEIDSVSITLNHEYNEKKIISPIESTWPKTIDTLTKALDRKRINPEHTTMICDVADNNAEKILKCRLDKQTEKEKEENNHKLGTTSQMLLILAEEQCQELFVNQYGEPYAAVKINGHTETLNLNHTRFKSWISKAYYEQENTVPSSESITNAINILKAKAEFDGKSKELHLRVAYDTEVVEIGTTRTTRTTFFYDLTNKEWEVIKITPDGWIIEKAHGIFRRHNAQPQVYPSIDYPSDIFDRFLKLLNVKDEKKVISQMLHHCVNNSRN